MRMIRSEANANVGEKGRELFRNCVDRAKMTEDFMSSEFGKSVVHFSARLHNGVNQGVGHVAHDNHLGATGVVGFNALFQFNVGSSGNLQAGLHFAGRIKKVGVQFLLGGRPCGLVAENGLNLTHHANGHIQALGLRLCADGNPDNGCFRQKDWGGGILGVGGSGGKNRGRRWLRREIRGRNENETSTTTGKEGGGKQIAACTKLAFKAGNEGDLNENEGFMG